MKRIMILLAVFLLLILPAQAQTQRVTDTSGLFTPEEAAAISETLDGLCSMRGVDLHLIIAEDSAGLHAQDFIPYALDSLYGDALLPDNAAFCICLDNRTYWFDGQGRMVDALESYGWNRLDDDIYYHLSEGNYAGAAMVWADAMVDICTPRTAFRTALDYMPFVLIIAALIAIIAVLVMIRQLKTARFKANAAHYVQENSLRLRDSSEIFLYETVTVRKIESSSSGGASSSGGRTGKGGSF